MNEPIQSFCARVIHLCEYVTDVNTLSDLKGIKAKAESVKAEAMGVQTVYGGRAEGKVKKK